MLEKKVRSFRHALRGVNIAWREEMNFKIEVVCGALAIAAASILPLTRIEFVVIIFLIGFVLATEALNTALEEFCDMVKSDHDPHIAKIKDLAAAAVLLSAITALTIGSTIFIPYLLPLA